MRKLSLILGLVVICTGLQAQKYFTRTGEISFFSSTSIEDIEAHNKTVTAVFDSKTGAIQYSVTIKAFHFEKALMEEHFNENYLESDDFPKASFKGVIVDIESINLKKDGMYTSDVKGKLTIHGVTQEIISKAQFTVKGEVIFGESKIKVNPEDYKIEIPGVVREKIAKELEVTMVMNFAEKK
ncbi:MAG: polyisoprenoid-binding protein YceI [Salibacteraceae bacterium]|jgi:polyisoprenoid-binding protein YceI